MKLKKEHLLTMTIAAKGRRYHIDTKERENSSDRAVQITEETAYRDGRIVRNKVVIPESMLSDIICAMEAAEGYLDTH